MSPLTGLGFNENAGVYKHFVPTGLSNRTDDEES
jgi:hypothetical protein